MRAHSIDVDTKKTQEQEREFGVPHGHASGGASSPSEAADGSDGSGRFVCSADSWNGLKLTSCRIPRACRGNSSTPGP